MTQVQYFEQTLVQNFFFLPTNTVYSVGNLLPIVSAEIYKVHIYLDIIIYIFILLTGLTADHAVAVEPFVHLPPPFLTPSTDYSLSSPSLRLSEVEKLCH